MGFTSAVEFDTLKAISTRLWPVIFVMCFKILLPHFFTCNLVFTPAGNAASYNYRTVNFLSDRWHIQSFAPYTRIHTLPIGDWPSAIDDWDRAHG